MRHFLAIGVVVYVAVLLARFPAELALHWFGSNSVTAYGVRGTVWAGSAQALRVANTTLGETTWDTRALSLLRGRLGAEVDTRSGESRLHASVSKSLFGDTISLRDVRGIIALADLPPGTLRQPVRGRVGVDLARIELTDGWPMDAVGSVDLVGLVLLQPQEVELGSFEVVFTEGDRSDGLIGVVGAVDSALDLDGTVTLAAPRSYAIAAVVKARPDTPADIVTALQFLGPPAPGGGVNLTFSASLAPH